jgi:hypothetical protein
LGWISWIGKRAKYLWDELRLRDELNWIGKGIEKIAMYLDIIDKTRYEANHSDLKLPQIQARPYNLRRIKEVEEYQD